jgi:hypothetical protein
MLKARAMETVAGAAPALQPPAASSPASSLLVGPVSGPASGPASGPVDIVDEWGRDSFPASDPPANW